MTGDHVCIYTHRVIKINNNKKNTYKKKNKTNGGIEKKNK